MNYGVKGMTYGVLSGDYAHAVQYHEAGHAVIAKAIGLGIDHVGYDPTAVHGNQRLGYVLFSEKEQQRLRAAMDDPNRKGSQNAILQHVVVALAGRAAALKAQKDDWSQLTLDWQDLSDVGALLRYVTNSEKKRDEYVAAAWNQVVKLIDEPDIWRAITATASLMAGRGLFFPCRVEGHEVRASVPAGMGF